MNHYRKPAKFRPGFRRAGNSRVLPLVIIAVLTAAGYFGKVKSSRQSEQQKEINATLGEYKSTVAEELQRDGTIGEAGIQAMDKVRAAMEKGATGTDPNSKAMGVLAKFIEKITAQAKTLTAISGKLMQMNAFDVSTHTNKAAIAERRALAAEIIEKNKAFIAFYTGSPSFIREELKRVGVTGAAADAQVRGFEIGQQRQLPSVTKIRQGDITIAGILNELCDLTDAELGKFTANKGGKVLFDNAGAAKKYNALLARVGEIEAEQHKAQQTLVENIRK